MTEERPADDCEYKLRKKLTVGGMGGTSSAEDVGKGQSDKKGNTFLKIRITSEMPPCSECTRYLVQTLRAQGLLLPGL